MAKNSIREASRNARAARLRRTRFLLVVIFILLLALAGISVWKMSAANSSDPLSLKTRGWVELPSGVRYADDVTGSGSKAVSGDTVAVSYTGWFEDGREFDASQPGQPLEFTLGSGMVISGWEEGIAGMQVGGKRMLVIPSASAYGAQGYPPTIPPNATLIFQVELVAIK